MYKRKNKKREPVKAPARDAFSNPLARLGFDMPTLLNGTEYVQERMTRDFASLNALYREHWIIRRIIDTFPADMLKNGWSYTTQLEPEAIKMVNTTIRKTRTLARLQEGMRWGRLYGGALGVMLIKGKGDNLEEPLDLESIMPGYYKGLLILDRWNGVSPSTELVQDTNDAEYGLPDFYYATDPATGLMFRIHHTRVIRFTGNPLPYWEELAEMHWGASIVEAVFEELKKRDNVSWNIAQLTFKANLNILKMNDLGQLLASTDNNSQRELYSTIQAQNMLMSNMGTMVMDAADGYESHQYTFTGLSEVYEQFMMDISGAAEYPATRLFGRSPSGENATGESDLQNYYDKVGEKQESELRPILEKLLPVIFMSTFGKVPDDLDFEFDPVAEPSDEERTDLAKSGTDIVVSAVQAGLVSPRTGLKELKQQSERTGMWTNITDEDIEKASDEIDNGEMGGMPGMGDAPPGMEEEQPPEPPPEQPMAEQA